MAKEYKITALDGIDAIRKVPGMYVGGVDEHGLNHLFKEIIDNSVDEFMAGHCNKIIITLHKDDSLSVEDNGRGIPFYHMQDKDKNSLEVVFTSLHSGGKFDKENYAYSGGLHGVGLSVINALSARLKVISRRDGKEASMVFAKGKKVEDLKEKGYRGPSGTLIRFVPDFSIFKGLKEFDHKVILEKVRELYYLCSGLSISFINENTGEKEEFNNSGGLTQFVKDIAGKKLLDEPIVFSDIKENIHVDVALMWVDEPTDYDTCKCYTNNIPNTDGGTHMIGFKSGITRTINSYVSSADLPKTMKISLSGDDVREGLVGVVSIRHPDPKFNSQDKVKLVSDDARTVVENSVSYHLLTYLEKNPTTGKKIITSCINAHKAREAAKKAREAIRKTVLATGMGVLPGKLADCSSKDPEECEIFIVEGDSAGGCFSGDAKISLADGRSLSFKELIKEDCNGKQNFCYSIENGEISIKPILNPRKTGINREVIKIVLDNGEEEICTPDHLFMLVDGTYEKAENLLGKSLFPLYKKISKREGRITISGYVNHKVVKIVCLKEKIDVYDLEVPNTHNFALSSGVFVHNSSKQGRDRHFQAILPLRGKVLNVEKCEFRKMLANEELTNLITALGCSIGKDFNIDGLRYNKIVIMCDADIDGAHIRTLLLTFFFRQMPQLIINGHIYIAVPPLYRTVYRGNIFYLRDDKHLSEFIKEKKIDKKSLRLQRFKGLGEMNPEQLWDTTMDPEKRIMMKVFIDNFVQADRVFSTLMGTSVDVRRELIIQNANKVNLDI